MSKLAKKLEEYGKTIKDKKILHTVFDGFFTFLFAPKSVTTGQGVHIRDGMDLKRTMVHVVLALQFCLLFGMYNIGHQHFAAFGLFSGGVFEGFFSKFFYGLFQLLPIIIVAHVVGLGIEFFFAAKKGHSIEEGFLVTGMLIPLIMPPAIPLWMVAVATAFAVIIGKEAFGGTGMNILNIALLTRVFIFFAYPSSISGDSCWVAYDYNILHDIFGLSSLTAGGFANVVDGFSGATPLALAAKGGWEAVVANYSVSDMFWGWIPGSIGEMSKPAVLLGAGMLIAMGIASWRIMLSMVLGAAFMGLILNLFATDPTSFIAVPFYYHFVMGSFFFAMAFMATDPVTASQTNTGKLIYGFMIGVIGIIVRVLNPAYPEGWMLAILFMNVFAPLIDHYIYQANIKRRLARNHG
ncbi:MAG: NADH:ubiquinone reductase (Na(+)-transporting) subunit B [Chitinophagales bacterium]